MSDDEQEPVSEAGRRLAATCASVNVGEDRTGDLRTYCVTGKRPGDAKLSVMTVMVNGGNHAPAHKWAELYDQMASDFEALMEKGG